MMIRRTTKTKYQTNKMLSVVLNQKMDTKNEQITDLEIRKKSLKLFKL